MVRRCARVDASAAATSPVCAPPFRASILPPGLDCSTPCRPPPRSLGGRGFVDQRPAAPRRNTPPPASLALPPPKDKDFLDEVRAAPGFTLEKGLAAWKERLFPTHGFPYARRSVYDFVGVSYQETTGKYRGRTSVAAGFPPQEVVSADTEAAAAAALEAVYLDMSQRPELAPHVRRVRSGGGLWGDAGGAQVGGVWSTARPRASSLGGPMP
jgi:hypothetical protein